jgi:hypothetical protein
MPLGVGTRRATWMNKQLGNQNSNGRQARRTSVRMARAVPSKEATSVTDDERQLASPRHASACVRPSKSGYAGTPSFCDGESGRASVQRYRCQADGGAAKAVLGTSNQLPGTSVNGSESAFALAGSMSKGVIAEMRCEYSGARALRSNTVCDLTA